MSIRQRLYPSPAQLPMMAMHTEHARYVYNLGLEQRRMWHPAKRDTFRVTYRSQSAELTEARAAYDWLAAGSQPVQQNALEDLDRAFRLWWSNPARFGKPSFRTRDENRGFAIKRHRVRRLNRKWATVTIPKAGRVKFRLTHNLAEVAASKSARITLSRLGEWHISFTSLPSPFERTATGSRVGIDRGVARTVSTSDGRHSTIPNLTTGERKRFLVLERQLARQGKGSKRREVTKRKLNRLRERLRNRRKDWIEKTTTALVRDYDVIALEDLKIRNMTRAPKPVPDAGRPGAYMRNGARAKANLNRAILASNWGEFARRLNDKATMTPEDHSVQVILVSPINTSRTCHMCGHVGRGNRKSQAVFCCGQCGHTAQADENAARNILSRAIGVPPVGRSTDASVAPPRGAASNLKAKSFSL